MTLLFIAILFSNLSLAYLTPGPSAKDSSHSSNQNSNVKSNDPNRLAPYSANTKPSRPAKYNEEKKRLNSSNLKNPEKNPGDPNNINKLGGKNWYDENNNSYLTPKKIITLQQQELIQLKLNQLKEHVDKISENPNQLDLQLNQSLSQVLTNDVVANNHWLELAQQLSLQVSSVTNTGIELSANELHEIQNTLHISMNDLTNHLNSGAASNDKKSESTVAVGAKDYLQMNSQQLMKNPGALYQFLVTQTKDQIKERLQISAYAKLPDEVNKELNNLATLSVALNMNSILFADMTTARSEEAKKQSENLAVVGLLAYQDLKNNPNFNLNRDDQKSLEESYNRFSEVYNGGSMELSIPQGQVLDKNQKTILQKDVRLILPPITSKDIDIYNDLIVVVTTTNTDTGEVTTATEKMKVYDLTNNSKKFRNAIGTDQNILKYDPIKDSDFEKLPDIVKQKLTDDTETLQNNMNDTTKSELDHPATSDDETSSVNNPETNTVSNHDSYSDYSQNYSSGYYSQYGNNGTYSSSGSVGNQTVSSDSDSTGSDSSSSSSDSSE